MALLYSKKYIKTKQKYISSQFTYAHNSLVNMGISMFALDMTSDKQH